MRNSLNVKLVALNLEPEECDQLIRMVETELDGKLEDFAAGVRNVQAPSSFLRELLYKLQTARR